MARSVFEARREGIVGRVTAMLLLPLAVPMELTRALEVAVVIREDKSDPESAAESYGVGSTLAPGTGSTGPGSDTPTLS